MNPENSSTIFPNMVYEKVSASDTILELQHVSASYSSSQTVLHDISAEIYRNQITSIIGPSGCGKSTLLKCLNRLLIEEKGAAIEGRIFLDEMETGSIPIEELRRRVGLVFQTPTPFPMSIYKNMTYALQYYGRHSKKELENLVKEKLELTGLYGEVKDELHRSALHLSGGQQQRLCIARALTVDPEILLLDEPCSSLDIQSTKTIEELLIQLRQRYTILIVTHNLAQARRISDRVLFLYEGRLIEEGTADELFHHPQSMQLCTFLSGESL